MTSRTKSIAIIIGTLLVGVIIGALATGAVFSQRVAELQALRSENGLSRFLESAIEPTDDAQKERIREILQKTAQNHMEIRRSVMMQHRDVFEEMRRELAEVLTAEQKDDLRNWMEDDRRRRMGGAGPGFMRQQGKAGRFERVPFDSTGGRRMSPRKRFRELERPSENASEVRDSTDE